MELSKFTKLKRLGLSCFVMVIGVGIGGGVLYYRSENSRKNYPAAASTASEIVLLCNPVYRPDESGVKYCLIKNHIIQISKYGYTMRFYESSCSRRILLVRHILFLATAEVRTIWQISANGETERIDIRLVDWSDYKEVEPDCWFKL